MVPFPAPGSLVQATVDEVLPRFGLAYLVDHQQGQWTITRQTPGLGLEGLLRGQRVHLTLAHYEDFTQVHHYDIVPQRWREGEDFTAWKFLRLGAAAVPVTLPGALADVVHCRVTVRKQQAIGADAYQA